MARMRSSGSPSSRRAARRDGGGCDTWTSRIGCAESACHAPRRSSSCTLPSDSASVRGSPETSLSAGRASNSVTCASRQRARRLQRQRQADRAGADHGQAQAVDGGSCSAPDQGARAADRAGVLFAAPGMRVGTRRSGAMALMDFIKKQFIDIIQWTEERRRHAGLALPDGGHRDPERRLADGARVADGGVRQRRQGGRRVRPRHATS